MTVSDQQVFKALRAAKGEGLKMMELAETLELDARGRQRLRKLLEGLEGEGKLVLGKGERYRIPGATAAASSAPADKVIGVGRIRVHPAGYGFVEREDGEADVFVPARFREGALDGDRVRVTTWLGVKGTEGRVEEVLERGRAKLTGVVRAAGRRLYLEPDDPRIGSTYGQVSLEEDAGGARVGQAVVAEIVKYPARAGGELVARVSHILGDPDDPRTEVAKIITCADIPDVFPDDVLDLARRTPQQLSPDDFADRLDLRDRAFLTIDPETARDFDDAICLEERGEGFRLWVAIADVSHYVRPGSALDREARIRGFSVYLPDRAIPMLPPELSAEMCSLKPEVDRCAMVVRVDLDAHGVPGDRSFAAAVIRSRARLDYPGVAAALAGDFRGPRARYQEHAEALRRMEAMAKKMRARRLKRGALDFDLPEATVLLDEDDPLSVRDVRRSKAAPEIKRAYQLVEEYMLAANEAVAEWLRERGLDGIWRIHEPPNPERLESFAQLARGYGIDFDAEEGTSPKVVQEVIAELHGKPAERALHFLLLRSLKQARYDVVPVGHFGLASKDYLHFTSPIRRYPDLVDHRLLKYHLRKEGFPSGGASHPAPPKREDLAVVAAECSAHERRAQEAEREVVDMYRAYLMRGRVGEELDGTVTAVTNFGMFVECDEPFVEGLVKLDALGDDFFYLDEKQMRLVGRRGGKVFQLGDRVRVRVENVSVPRRRIDLSIVRPDKEEALPVARKNGGDRRRSRARRR
jgi:ribonuclease R